MIIMIQMEQATNEMLLCHRGGGYFSFDLLEKKPAFVSSDRSLSWSFIDPRQNQFFRFHIYKVLYFLKALDSRISNMTFPYVMKIMNVMNTRIQSAQMTHFCYIFEMQVVRRNQI